MNVPPCLMRLKVYNQKSHVNLWIPLFLAWIILGILALALIPVVLILVLILWPLGWGVFLVKAGPAFYRLLCALRGLKIDINQDKEIVLVYFK
jgi:hypothetical protein